ncbi:hypothetical protein JOD63_000072 [Microbacterium terrae]|uniref:Carbohydrate-binding domain-containing protein n=1 Tax=Microbacterium terrae TaxID=69369 RepID=A0A0M2GY46_9MICO|nr:sugar-binding protein [Microbacterium terrae]KJL38685.1 hypothetical protein RS81_02480 [Microbacterium terrae]MBP1076104.1 hypothetical protein [Microbacterium terrae]GLJ96924.1 hypothetical protein GCM10017594_01210 [Microbacterium terrae]
MNPSRLRRLGAAPALVAALVLGTLAATPAAAADPLTVEGESPTSTNITPGAAAQNAASGGRSLQLYTAAAAPAGGYVASYEVTVPAASHYRLDATTIPVGVAWASPYRFRVNDGAWQDTSKARQLAVVSPELRTYELGTVTLAEGVNTVTFQVTERRTSPNTNYAMFLDAFTLTPVPVQLASVTAPDRFGVFEAGESVSLEAALNADAPGETAVEWTVADYDGAEIAAGTTTVATGGTIAAIDLGDDLDTGAYRVEARLAGETATVTGAFAVLPSSADRADIDDSPFAVDVYGSKLIASDDAEAFAHVLELTGVDWIRDRQRWNDVINPRPGTIDFSGEQQPQAWLEAADAAGLKTMSSFHDGPSWTRTSTRELPQDLRDMYAFALAAGEHYDGLVDAWQLWNEQNRKFALESEGADRYASVIKAAALGFLDSGTDAQMIGGGLAGVDPHYAQWQFRNGILDYLDAYAYHTHTTVNSIASGNAHPDFSSQISAAEAFGGDAKGRWVTEAGIALNTADATQLPTAGQEKLQARYIVTSAAESLAQGSTKQFFFIAAPYREGVSYWSMYRSPDEPMAALTAQSVLTAELGEGRYAGRLSGLPEGVSAYVFDTGAEPTAVLWADVDTEVSIRVKGNTGAVTDLMGRPADAAVKGGKVTLTVGPDPVYVSAPKGFRGVEAAPAHVAPAAAVTADGFTDAERVIVQQVFDADTSKNAQLYGYGLSTTAPTALTAELYNFNDHDVTAVVSATAEGGWQVAGAGTGVGIPAGGRVEVPLTITPGADLQQSIADLTIVATVDGEASSPSVTELRPRTAALAAAHIVVDGEDRLRVTYTNATGAAQHISRADWSFGDDSDSTAESIEVAPGARVALDSPAAPAGAGETEYRVAVHVDGVGVVSTRGILSARDHADVATVAERTIVVDGVRDDLADAPGQRLAAPGVDADSIAATAWFTWDDEHLYLTAEVRDDIHTQPFTGNATWQADGLQFAIAPGWPGETALRPEIQPRIEFGFARTPAGPQLYRYASGSVGGFLTDLDIAAVRDESTGVTTYEAAVPWSTLSPIGVGPASAASLSIVANDADGDGTRGWVQWGGGITTAKDSELFEPVIFG